MVRLIVHCRRKVGKNATHPFARRVCREWSCCQQNTSTGKLTEAMFRAVFLRARRLLR
jgi:hypothetical protein